MHIIDVCCLLNPAAWVDSTWSPAVALSAIFKGLLLLLLLPLLRRCCCCHWSCSCSCCCCCHCCHYAYNPGSSSTNKLDGVVILFRSMPGGSAAPYNLGKDAHSCIHSGVPHSAQQGSSGRRSAMTLSDEKNANQLVHGPATARRDDLCNSRTDLGRRNIACCSIPAAAASSLAVFANLLLLLLLHGSGFA
jgi:hypothetical protein